MTPQTTTHQQPAKPKIPYLGRTSSSVESRTRPGHMHYVDTYRLTCTCEAGTYGRRCWALVAALGFEDWRRRQQTQAAAASTNRATGMAALQDAS